MRVLVTGAFGWTAAAIVQALRRSGHDVVAFDLPTASCPAEIREQFDHMVVGTVANLDDVYRAAQSVDSVIHLSIATGHENYQRPDVPFAVNVKGAYNVFESARRRGIQRLVLLSSAAVHMRHREGERQCALSDWKSSDADDHLYDLTKRLQEEIARDFCCTYDLDAVVLRAGHIVDGRMDVDPSGRPLSSLAYCRGGWVCRYDLAAACVKALELKTSGYTAFHVIGASEARRRFDIARTEAVLGLVFETRFEQYRTV